MTYDVVILEDGRLLADVEKSELPKTQSLSTLIKFVQFVGIGALANCTPNPEASACILILVLSLDSILYAWRRLSMEMEASSSTANRMPRMTTAEYEAQSRDTTKRELARLQQALQQDRKRTQKYYAMWRTAARPEVADAVERFERYGDNGLGLEREEGNTSGVGSLLKRYGAFFFMLLSALAAILVGIFIVNSPDF